MKTVSDSTLDAQVLQALSDLGIQKMKSLHDSTSTLTFNVPVLLESFSNYFSGDSDGQESLGGPRFLHHFWHTYTRQVYICDFLNGGPIGTTLKTRKNIVRKQHRQIAEERRPEYVKIRKIFIFFVYFSIFQMSDRRL